MESIRKQPQSLPLKIPPAFKRDKRPPTREKTTLSEGRESLSLRRGSGDGAGVRREAPRKRRPVWQPDEARRFGTAAATLKGQITKRRDAPVKKKT